jgi:hypothetical protein
MKKTILFLSTLFLVSNVFAQNLLNENFPSDDFQKQFTLSEALDIYRLSSQELSNDKAIRILLGEKELLDDYVDIFSLGKINKKYYRIIRNMIYAKYGYIFNTPELANFFSRYDWYKPAYTNVDSRLTAIDKYNIKIVQAFESMNENTSTISWNNRKTGIWQTSPAMAAGWSDRFVIYADNRLEYYDSQMRQLPLRVGMTGVYTIKGNVLEFQVNKMIYLMTDSEIEVNGMSGYAWENSKSNTIIFEKPIIYKFPVTVIFSKEFGKNNELTRETITFGGQEYYKLSDNVNDKF